MPTRDGHAKWEGSIEGGSGTLNTADGALDAQYSFSSRFEDGEGTNPEAVIAAAHASCYSMALSLFLGENDLEPNSIETTAKVNLKETSDGGFEIDKITLETEADVPGVEDDKFQEIANTAKDECLVSKALAGPEITLKAKLSG